jgi:phosphoinositide-3-kinase regulatory subunit 4
MQFARFLTPLNHYFTAGCVLIELFTDGTAHPFSFSQLLAYRAGEYEPKKVLDKIDDEQIKVIS